MKLGRRLWAVGILVIGILGTGKLTSATDHD